MFNFTIDRPAWHSGRFRSHFPAPCSSFFYSIRSSVKYTLFHLMYERMLILNLDSLYKSNDLFHFSFALIRSMLLSKTWTKHSSLPFLLGWKQLNSLLFFLSQFLFSFHSHPKLLGLIFPRKKHEACKHRSELIFMSLLFTLSSISLQATFIAQYSTKTLSIERICHGWWSTRKYSIIYCTLIHITARCSREHHENMFVKRSLHSSSKKANEK